MLQQEFRMDCTQIKRKSGWKAEYRWCLGSMHAFSRDTSCANHVGHVARGYIVSFDPMHMLEIIIFLDGRIRWMQVDKISELKCK
jgi:hypothetical protein